MRTRKREWSPLVALVVLALHALAIHALMAWRPTGWRLGDTARTDATRALVIEFIPRRRSEAETLPQRPAVTETTMTVSATVAPSVSKSRRTHAISLSPAARSGSSPREPSPAPLDLTLDARSAASAFREEAPRWLERRPAIEVRRTRFHAAWVPDGDAIAQARHRSTAVRVVTGVFGGPPRRCTEIERRLRRPDCLALEADEADAEALRRSLD